MLENIEVLYHSCIKFNYEKTIYIDPYGLKTNYNDADIILITHSHFDHFSEEDIKKVKKKETIIIAPTDLYDKSLALNFKNENITIVEPNNTYKVEGITIKTIPSYNTNKNFHPKENKWVGYLINLNNTIYYIAGDTDINEDNKKVTCEVAFVPVGGTYTMTATEAADLVNTIKPKFAVPIHYGSVVGKTEDAKIFVQHLDKDIVGKILMQ